MGEEDASEGGEWPSLDFDLDSDDLADLEDLFGPDFERFEREFEEFKKDVESGAWDP